MRYKNTHIAGWGNYPSKECFLYRPEKQKTLDLQEMRALPRGLGRSYGDASIHADHTVVLMERLNRLLEFDPETGILRAEAGVSLEHLLNVFVARGWFIPVTPGTKYVTLGGCIAADVHGKNHHRDGTFGQHIIDLELLLADGRRVRCGPNHNPELFWATVGGMGLTGIITEATIQLTPIETSFIKVRHHLCANLDAAIKNLSDPDLDDQYSVAWIDCLSTGKSFGRSILMTGHHATLEDLPKTQKESPLEYTCPKKHSVPFNMPSFLLTPWTVKAFNSCYHWTQSRKTEPFVTDIDTYFYPLDSIDNWNRCYGKKGFLQYQFVVPFETAQESLRLILEKLAESRRASFLAVLKRFGPENPGYLSFPKKGFTLALDIPIKDEELFPFLDELDEIVLKYEGRIYLAKDARVKPKAFRKMYPRFGEWLEVKSRIDPEWIFNSDLAKRLYMEAKR